jgi:hypothetical protein
MQVSRRLCQMGTYELCILVNKESEASRAISSLSSRLESELSSSHVSTQVCWHAPDTYRVRLHALGNLDQLQLDDAKHRLASLQADQLRRFRVKIGRVGASPSWNKPRTLWAAPSSTKERKPLKSMQQWAFKAFGSVRRSRFGGAETHRASDASALHICFASFQEIYTPSLRWAGDVLAQLPSDDYAIECELDVGQVHLIRLVSESVHLDDQTVSIVASQRLLEQQQQQQQ